MCDDVSCYGMSCEEFEKDLLRCDDLLARLDPTWRRKKWRWFRPPRGYLNEEMLDPLNRLGYRVALADVFPLDTAVRSVDWLVDFVMEKTRPGSIVLLHTPDLREAHDRRNNVQVFRDLCPRLAAEFEVGTLSELVERRRPTPPSRQPCHLEGQFLRRDTPQVGRMQQHDRPGPRLLQHEVHEPIYTSHRGI